MVEEVRDVEARRQIEVIKEVLQVLLDDNSKEIRLRKLGEALQKFPKITIKDKRED